MDGIYRLLVKATLVAAVMLIAVTVAVSVTAGTAALSPMVLLAAAAAGYSAWRIRHATD